MAGDFPLPVQVPSEMLLDRGVEGTAEINGVLRRKDDLCDELSVGRVRADIGELEYDGVVRDGNLRRIRECRMRGGWYLDLNVSFWRHKSLLTNTKRDA